MCFVITVSTHTDGSDELNVENETEVTIVLTKFDVNDTSLEMDWKIRNNTDHDVWTCESIHMFSPQFEVFLDKDAKTLVIRRQFNIPKEEGVIWELPKRGLFVRLRPGQEKAESLSLEVPVQPSPVYGLLHEDSEFASRLTLEIGFFNE